MKGSAMAKQRQVNENWNISFTRRDKNSSEDIINLSMSWENGDVEHVMENLNTWLTAIKMPLKVVENK
jgi:hypothetical protein